MLKNHARFAAVTASVVGVTMAVGGAPASSASAGSIPYGGASATASGFGVSSAVAASLQRPGTYVTMSKSNDMAMMDTADKVTPTIPARDDPSLAIAARPSSANPTAAVCTSSRNPKIADAVSHDINAALAGRTSTVAVGVDDPGFGVTCRLRADQNFDSASVVKVIILGALLRQAQEQHRYLTPQEDQEATIMITKSDNDAATALWQALGRAALQHLLRLAGMNQTVLGPDGYWGLTQITAQDQLKLLSLLDNANTVLNGASRHYALDLMSRVVAAQRWGVPAGTPIGFTIHVKNGWLARPTRGWRINSIGSFSGHDRTYAIVVLTQDNASMAYGVTTVENVARAVHKDLNPGQLTAVGPSRPSASWEASDEEIRDLPNTP
jgi:beta-lactamase class A